MGTQGMDVRYERPSGYVYLPEDKTRPGKGHEVKVPKTAVNASERVAALNRANPAEWRRVLGQPQYDPGGCIIGYDNPGRTIGKLASCLQGRLRKPCKDCGEFTHKRNKETGVFRCGCATDANTVLMLQQIPEVCF